VDIKTMSVEAATAVADALAEAADELEAIANGIVDRGATGSELSDAGQMRNDGRWLRRKAVTIRAELAGI
jgi:hypothetical protein